MKRPPSTRRRRKGVSYAKWGYIFIAPFFIVYAIFTLYPQLLTIYNSFFENYRSGLNQVGPNFVGLQNYITLFTPDSDGTISILKYAGNTIILWLGGAIPQIAVALLLAVFFTSYRLKIRGQRFFKTVIYMPNLIMASAFSMLFYTLFSPVGPINQIMLQFGWSDVAIDFFSYQVTVRGMICLMNFLLWFGNTTILLMAGIMGIPMLKPALAVQLIFTFVQSWNNYFMPALLLDKAEMKTVPIMIAQLRAADYSKFDMGKVYMFILLAILPVLVVYIFLSKYIIKGVTAGSVKG